MNGFFFALNAGCVVYGAFDGWGWLVAINAFVAGLNFSVMAAER